MRAPAGVRRDATREVVPGALGGGGASLLRMSRRRLRRTLEVRPRGIVLDRQRARHGLPRSALVEVKRRDGVGVCLALRRLGQGLKPPPALLGAAEHTLEGRRRGEDVRDEPPVGAELVHNGAQQLVLDGCPHARHPGRSLLCLVGLLLTLVVSIPVRRHPLLALLPLLVARLLQRRQGDVAVFVVVRGLCQHWRLAELTGCLGLACGGGGGGGGAQALVGHRASRMRPLLPLGVELVELEPGGGSGGCTRRRLRRLMCPPPLRGDPRHLCLRCRARRLDHGARTPLLILLPVAKSPLVVRKLHTLRLNALHPPLLRLAGVAVVQQRGVAMVLHPWRCAWCHGRKI
mmetsp:Transcript_30383/g.76022  ORF Transcript_30383/g.76022 Transcript_30383/m.76022 type:complete len:346 (-) Transcript_30383:818-1855(-)